MSVQENTVVWRDDRKPVENPEDEEPIIGHFLTFARDVIEERATHKLSICHVLCRGKGKCFMASVQTTGSVRIRNGAIHPGTDSATYDKAKEEGLKLLEEESVR